MLRKTIIAGLCVAGLFTGWSTAQATGWTTKLVSVATNGTQGTSDSKHADISDDGRYVLFETASPLVTSDTDGVDDVYVRDRVTNTTQPVYVDGDGMPVSGESYAGGISANGRFVVFNVLYLEQQNPIQVLVRDMQTRTVRRVSLTPSGGEPNGNSFGGDVTNDGRYVSFASTASNIAPGDEDVGPTDFFVRDTATGSAVLLDAGAGDAAISVPDGAMSTAHNAPDLTPDGRYAAYVTVRAVVTEDRNGIVDVYRRDLATGRDVLVSMSNGRSGNGRSTTPRVSNDGRSVAFVSGMTDVAGDRNGATADVFLRDLGATNAMRLTSAQAPADRPDISAEGKFVAFTTTAALVSSDTNGLSDVYGRMLSDGSLTHLSATENRRTGTTGESSAPSVSGWLNGAYVTAFASGASNLVPSDTNGTTRDIFVRMPVS